MNSKHDGSPVCDIDEAILMLEDMISGADEDRDRDSRISGVIRLLKHLKARGNQSWTTPEVSRLFEYLNAKESG